MPTVRTTLPIPDTTAGVTSEATSEATFEITTELQGKTVLKNINDSTSEAAFELTADSAAAVLEITT